MVSIIPTGVAYNRQKDYRLNIVIGRIDTGPYQISINRYDDHMNTYVYGGIGANIFPAYPLDVCWDGQNFAVSYREALVGVGAEKGIRIIHLTKDEGFIEVDKIDLSGVGVTIQGVTYTGGNSYVISILSDGLYRVYPDGSFQLIGSMEGAELATQIAWDGQDYIISDPTNDKIYFYSPNPFHKTGEISVHATNIYGLDVGGIRDQLRIRTASGVVPPGNRHYDYEGNFVTY